MALSREIVDEIKDLVDIDALLSLIGFVPKYRNSKEIRGACPIHRGNNVTAFRFNIEKRTFACFTKGCQETGNDIVNLVMKCFGCDFMTAIKYLADLAGINLDLLEIDPAAVEKREIKRFMSIEEKMDFYNKLSSEVPEDMAKLFMLNRDNYYIDRGFSEEILDYFEVGKAYDAYGVSRATIPVRDDVCRLVGILGRRTDCDDPPKFIPIDDSLTFDKSKILYNMCSAKSAIDSTAAKSVIIVEGFTDVWNLVRHGFLNTVAVMTARVLEPQVQILSKYCLTVCLMLDGDTAGQEGTVKSKKLLEQGFKVKVIPVPDGKDPGNMTINETQAALVSGGYYQ
jgi:DNA primase